MNRIAISGILAASAALSDAATLTYISQQADPNATQETSLTLPSGSGTDWGYWTRGSGGTAGPLSPANTSTDGAIVMTISTYNGGNLRGPTNATTGAPHSYFDFTNGTPAVLQSSTDLRPTGIFNSQLGTTGANALAGINLNLSGFTQASTIQIWTYGYNSTGTVQAFVNGSTTPIYEATGVTTGNPGNGKTATLYTFDFTPDSTSSSVTFRYFLTGAAADPDAAHVAIQAVAISPIPEPASAFLAALAGLPLLMRRRR